MLLFPKYLTFLLVFAASAAFISCGQNNEGSADYASDQTTPARGDWVVVALGAEPTNLNPSNYDDEPSENVSHQIFQRLLDRDHTGSYEIIPQLAVKRPDISPDGLRYTFEIRPEAKWDNGKPITAKDVLFSFKIYKNPYVDCPEKRPYFDVVKGLEIDPDNERKFAFILKQPYMRAESALGMDLVIFPEYIYDPEGVMAKYTLEQLTRLEEPVEALPEGAEKTLPEGVVKDRPGPLQTFAKQYNSAKYSKNPEFMRGSGPYEVTAWDAGQKIELTRKENWWGDALLQVKSLEAWPEKIVYRILPDEQARANELKAQRVDVLPNIMNYKLYNELKGDPRVAAHYNFSEPLSYNYTYFGLNNRPPANRKPYFADQRVRRAMAHLLPADRIIERLISGMAVRITSTVFPQQKKYYNESLKPIPFDVEKAKALLAAAGWKDSNNNGVRDSLINGELVELRPEALIGPSEIRKQIALVYKQEAAKAGVEMRVKTLENQTMYERMNRRDFDMYYGGWASSPDVRDPKQLWHTESWQNQGSNFVGFGNAETDALIEQIRAAADEQERIRLYKEFQRVVYEWQPYVFFVSTKTPLAVHKRFRGAETSSMRPNFQANSFWTPEGLVKYKTK